PRLRDADERRGVVVGGEEIERGIHLRQTEVEDLQPAALRQKDVLRLQIAMDDSAIVRGGHAARDGGGVLDRAARRERAARDALAKRLAFEQLQHDVERIAGRAEVVHGDEVRMIEEAEGARLLLESRDDL